MNVGYLLGAYTAHGVNAYRESCGNHKKKLRIKVNSKENRSISNETMVKRSSGIGLYLRCFRYSFFFVRV